MAEFLSCLMTYRVYFDREDISLRYLCIDINLSKAGLYSQGDYFSHVRSTLDIFKFSTPPPPFPPPPTPALPCFSIVDLSGTC